LCDLAPQRVGLDEVDERLLAVDLDDRDQLAIPPFELRVAADIDLLEVEAKLVAQLDDRRPRALAEVATLGAVQTN
jgi:hypothetical protein